jgi:hypothetical protein
MAASDPVPCFYTGQDYRWEKPAKILTRAEVRELKLRRIGNYIENGKMFLFSQRKETALLFGGKPSAKNILAFIKTRTDGAKLHYETPMAGDGNWLNGYTPRREIYVSARSKFNDQVLPAGVGA